jgi:sugar lactone lactonase YvrE
MSQIDFVVNGRDRLGEVPLWCTHMKRLWWPDVRAPALQSYDAITRTHELFSIPGKVAGSFAFRQKGGVILGMDTGLNAHAGRPDGATVDADGFLWNARAARRGKRSPSRAIGMFTTVRLA